MEIYMYIFASSGRTVPSSHTQYTQYARTLTATATLRQGAGQDTSLVRHIRA